MRNIHFAPWQNTRWHCLCALVLYAPMAYYLTKAKATSWSIHRYDCLFFFENIEILPFYHIASPSIPLFYPATYFIVLALTLPLFYSHYSFSPFSVGAEFSFNPIQRNKSWFSFVRAANILFSCAISVDTVYVFIPFQWAKQKQQQQQQKRFSSIEQIPTQRHWKREKKCVRGDGKEKFRFRTSIQQQQKIENR